MKRLSFILLLFFSAACYHLKERSVVMMEPRAAKLPFLDSVFIAHAKLTSAPSVQAFYETHEYAMVWADSSGLLPFAESLRSIVRASANYGLIPTDYHLQAIDSLLKAEPTDHNRLTIDAYLTDDFFTLSHHLKFGRMDSTHTARMLSIASVDQHGVEQLNHILTGANILPVLESQQPAHAEYHLLKDSLQRMLAKHQPDSATQRAMQQLTVNMERWRWVTNKPSRYVRVNIPSFLMQVVNGDSVAMESNVVVGTPLTPTPELTSVIKSFIIYPYWHVPRGIAINEILPHVKKDSAYLNSHRFDILDQQGNVLDGSSIQWSSLNKDNFPYIFRQREGSDNALGIIKFSFANEYGVYLHDTNARRHFTKEKRALSHGCVRVHQAIPLARYLTKDDSVYVSPEDLDQYLSLRRRVEIKVVNPIPLFIEYFTCEYKNGVIRFYDDVYKKDEQVIQALYRRQNPSLNPGQLLAVK